MRSENYVLPDWPAPDSVRAVTTLRGGGVSVPPFDSFNLAKHVGDQEACVYANREQLRDSLGFDSASWLNQVHGSDVYHYSANNHALEPVTADACWTDTPNLACAVLTADCLPCLVCDRAGTRVLAIHAGWRGMVNGVISTALEAAKMNPQEALVWLGPAIGADSYQVGEDVLNAFRGSFFFQGVDVATAFVPDGEKHYRCDLYRLARLQLSGLGVPQVFGGDQCTLKQENEYFSYRRDGQTGRMASLIWLE